MGPRRRELTRPGDRGEPDDRLDADGADDRADRGDDAPIPIAPNLVANLMCWASLHAAMQTYPVKPGHAGKIDFKMIFEAAFGSYEEDDGWLKGSFGSMPKVWAKQEGKKAVVVDTDTDKSIAIKISDGGPEAEAAMQLAQDTQRTWNDFLEGVTGYDAKKRSKKLQEAAKKAA